MFCENCGSALENGSRFCESCGAPVSNSGSDLEQGAELHRTGSSPRAQRSRIFAIALSIVTAIAALAAYKELGASFSRPFSRVPQAISTLVFEKSNFNAPILLGVCQDADRSSVAQYKQQLSAFSGGLPPLGPVAGWRCEQQKLQQLMRALGFVEFDSVTDPFFTQGTRTYFYYTPKLNPYLSSQEATFGSFARYINVAKRHMDTIDYTHSGKINFLGMGETESFSMTFSYSLRTLIPGFPNLTKEFKGKAVVVLDTGDGQWKLLQLDLGDRGETEFLEVINAPTFQISRTGNPHSADLHRDHA